MTDPKMSIIDDFHGPITVGVDVVHPSDVYVHVMGRGRRCGNRPIVASAGRRSAPEPTATSRTRGTNDRSDRHDPHRDPATSPTLYVTQGYGANSVWKSTDGGVNWADVWNNNIFAEDGVTNISKDVGNDISGMYLVDSSGPDYLILYLHSYYGTLGNNGIFESKDGGGKWIVHKAQTFNFQPHSDVLFPFDATTWMVTHGNAVYRTTDSGATWKVDDGMVSRQPGAIQLHRRFDDLCRYRLRRRDLQVARQGPIVDRPEGAWQQDLEVAATATKLYASNDRSDPHVYHASLTNDKVWVDDGAPGMVHGGANTPGVLFDGAHYVLIAPSERGGVWRYVEP